MLRATLAFTLPVLLLTVAPPAHAIPTEIVIDTQVGTSFETAWGRLVRYGRRAELSSQEELRRFHETLRLASHDRDLGWLEIEIKRDETFRFRVHMIPLGGPGCVAPECRLDVRIWATGRSRVLAQRYAKALLEVIQGATPKT